MWKKYLKSKAQEMRPYLQDEVLSGKISISDTDRQAGSPKVGDMIARNPIDHDDQWLVSEEFFRDNYIALDSLETLGEPHE